MSKTPKKPSNPVNPKTIQDKILFVRGQLESFPNDFLLPLTQEQLTILKCQFGTSSWEGFNRIQQGGIAC